MTRFYWMFGIYSKVFLIRYNKNINNLNKNNSRKGVFNNFYIENYIVLREKCNKKIWKVAPGGFPNDFNFFFVEKYFTFLMKLKV